MLTKTLCEIHIVNARWIYTQHGFSPWRGEGAKVGSSLTSAECQNDTFADGSFLKAWLTALTPLPAFPHSELLADSQAEAQLWRAYLLLSFLVHVSCLLLLLLSELPTPPCKASH